MLGSSLVDRSRTRFDNNKRQYIPNPSFYSLVILPYRAQQSCSHGKSSKHKNQTYLSSDKMNLLHQPQHISKKGCSMNLPGTYTNTLVSALDTYRLSLKDVLITQGQSLPDSLERNEIVHALRLSQIISKALETGKEASLREEDYIFLDHVILTERSYIKLTTQNMDKDSIDYICAQKTQEELSDTQIILGSLLESQTQPCPQQIQ